MHVYDMTHSYEYMGRRDKHTAGAAQRDFKCDTWHMEMTHSYEYVGGWDKHTAGAAQCAVRGHP